MSITLPYGCLSVTRLVCRGWIVERLSKEQKQKGKRVRITKNQEPPRTKPYMARGKGWNALEIVTENALDGQNLRSALKERDLDGGGPRLQWKEKRDDERRWRWRVGVI
ncbi:hypothetical protein TNCV_4490991 [Trichonephila clavipes]|nr:hypothetical protein TNCV_4490991 [Trichonephila clavipes]